MTQDASGSKKGSQSQERCCGLAVLAGAILGNPFAHEVRVDAMRQRDASDRGTGFQTQFDNFALIA